MPTLDEIYLYCLASWSIISACVGYCFYLLWKTQRITGYIWLAAGFVVKMVGGVVSIVFAGDVMLVISWVALMPLAAFINFIGVYFLVLHRSRQPE